MTQSKLFEGFDPTNTTPVPDALFDRLLPELSGVELKVLLYILRRTKGFKKDADAISFSQFLNGITTKDGKVLDRGCGVVSRTTLSKTLGDLELKGYITTTKGIDPAGDKSTTLFSVRFKSTGVVRGMDYPPNMGSAQNGLPVVRGMDYGSTQTVPGVVRGMDQQETVLQDTVKQDTVQQGSNTSNNLIQPVFSLPALPTNTPPPTNGHKPTRTRQQKLSSLEEFDLNQLATIEAIMALGDIWRGGPLPAVKRADSNYQKALLEGATPLSQRQRQGGKKGYTLQEIDAAYRFYKRIAPEGKPWLIAEDWWTGKPVDLWVIAKNIDKALAEIAKLEKEHGTPTTSGQPANLAPVWTPEDGDPRRFKEETRLRYFAKAGNSRMVDQTKFINAIAAYEKATKQAKIGA